MPDSAFPMYVLPVSAVLALERLPTHEAVVNQLRKWAPGMTTLFCSQTWLAYAHPDNATNDKLHLLQTFLRDVSKRDIEPNSISALVFGSRLNPESKM